MPSVPVVVDLRPGVRALTSVISVLHARAADVTAISYAAGEGHAALGFSVDAMPAQVRLLVRQLERRVDVLAVRLGDVVVPDNEDQSCLSATTTGRHVEAVHTP